MSNDSSSSNSTDSYNWELSEEEWTDYVGSDTSNDNEYEEEPPVSASQSQHAELIEIIDMSAIDAEDESIIRSFYGEDSHKCCLNGCNELIPKELAVNHRLMFQEMTRSEQDVVILAQLQQCRRITQLEDVYGDLTKRGHLRLRTTSDSLQRKEVQYFFCGVPICRAMYFFLHNIGTTRYKNLCKHFDINGILPRVHKSSNKTPNRDNVLLPNVVEEVVQFIKSFADNYGLPLPGRLPNFKNYDVIKLPSNETKTSIHRKYCDTISTRENSRLIARTTFTTIWKKYCPYVTIMKPADDLCGTCRTNQLEIIRSANLNEDVKQSKLNSAAEHLNNARKQREYYNNWRKLANSNEVYEDKDGIERSFSVLSFDFAENLNYPFHAQQVGPIYFKTPRKCGLFGIHNEASHCQTHFLIDEADSIGKGANATISLLHHHLQLEGGKDTLVLFADNAVGQNKNNAVLQYLLWRVLTGKNRVILYNFLVAGHTKFSPDRSFGILKKKYSTSTIDSLNDLAMCVNKSSHKGLQKAIITYDPSLGKHFVTWSNWTEYLQKLFVKLPGLTQFHHFIFNSDGSLNTKEYADSKEHCSFLVKANWTADEALIIEDIIPEGLTLERQWYLFDNVRQFIIDESKKDAVAPKPLKPKPTKVPITTDASNTEGTSTCHNEGEQGQQNTPGISSVHTPRRGRPRKLAQPNQQSKPITSTSGLNPAPKKSSRGRGRSGNK